MPKSAVYARLPRGGLGNKLLVWARAQVFANRYGLTLYVSGWADIKIGPYLRRERSKRKYWDYFEDTNAPSPLRRLMFSVWYEVHHEPDLESGPPVGSKKSSQLYLFDTVPSWRDYFHGLRGHEEMIRAAFASSLRPHYRSKMINGRGAVIGVHVRRSDFRVLAPGESLGENCNVRTPTAYYVNVIDALRRMAGKTLPVTVFTDGRAEDIAELMALPEVEMAGSNPDIVDLILLSKSGCLITSAGSTFGYWAAYLSDGPVIIHPAHAITIRSKVSNINRYEGSILYEQPWDPGLTRLIEKIAHSP